MENSYLTNKGNRRIDVDEIYNLINLNDLKIFNSKYQHQNLSHTRTSLDTVAATTTQIHRSSTSSTQLNTGIIPSQMEDKIQKIRYFTARNAF
ncbi:hypothetical protein Glove_117g372 [Diversispora epigaea]|uniref:Uncharacterized protein n=1 Tax=Diversispora epigaea TaxID=1348612 RepID=A0A397J0M9_9GLOM|nr:hypothetical protein Glove_117g372 [Diversispora epigaea]